MDKQLKQNLVVTSAITDTVTKTLAEIQSTAGTSLPDATLRQMVGAALQKRLSRHFVK